MDKGGSLLKQTQIKLADDGVVSSDPPQSQAVAAGPKGAIKMYCRDVARCLIE